MCLPALLAAVMAVLATSARGATARQGLLMILSWDGRNVTRHFHGLENPPVCRAT